MIDRDDAEMLAALVVKTRREHAPKARQFKPEKVMAAAFTVRGRSLGSTICAFVRGAMDPGLQREEGLPSAGSHWGDTMLVSDVVHESIPDDQKCSICHFSEPHCRLNNPVSSKHSHEFDSVAAARRRREQGTPEATATVIAALKDELAHTDPRPAPPTGLTTEGKPELADRLASIVANNQGLQAPPMQQTEEGVASG